VVLGMKLVSTIVKLALLCPYILDSQKVKALPLHHFKKSILGQEIHANWKIILEWRE